MSSLTATEKRRLELLLEMSSGFVLGFSDRTFGEFLLDAARIDIHSERYHSGSNSKANKLRQFWRVDSDATVGKALLALIDWRGGAETDPEDVKLVAQCRAIANRLLSGAPQLDALKNLAATFDARHLAEQVHRMEKAIEEDPSLAIGTAKELIETCCKTILAERGKPVTGTPEISTLTKETLKELKLVPDGVPDSARGADVIKRLLMNLGTIGNGLAELRGLYGTGHGKDGRAKGLEPRHATLAVGAAATLARFLFETHEATKPRPSS